MQLQFLGAAGTVTGSCYLLDTKNTRLMVDCGMFQGFKNIRERNYGKFLVPPDSVDYILLTHAHIDHSGLIPKFVKHGFRGKIIASAPTVELCQVLLPDSGHIQEMEIERKNRKNRRANKALIEPIYNVQDAYNSLSAFKSVMYDEMIQLTPEIRVRYVDAGHILGSAMVEIWVKEGEEENKLVFSGDIGRTNQPLINDPTVIKETDYLIMESTYGNRRHREGKDEKELLHDVIWETYKKGGNLIIPAFAVERTQDLLYHISLLTEAKRMPPMNIYIDSPLSTAATGIFHNNQEYFDKDALDLIERGGDPMFLRGIKFTKTAAESMALNKVNGAIIISASGMCEAGRIRHHLKYNLWRPDSTVLFVGYQAEGTLGRLILNKEKSVRIFGDEIAVKADIRSIEGYSAHADQIGLLDWVGGFRNKPKEVFVVHGEPAAANTLAYLLRTNLGVNVTVPIWRQSVNLFASRSGGAFKQGYESLLTKLRNAMEYGLVEAQQEEIIQRMAALETYLTEELNKTS